MSSALVADCVAGKELTAEDAGLASSPKTAVVARKTIVAVRLQSVAINHIFAAEAAVGRCIENILAPGKLQLMPL